MDPGRDADRKMSDESRSNYSFFHHKPAVITGLRFLLGAVFTYAGLIKLLHPNQFADILYGYDLLHPRLITLVALTLPFLEILCGVCLLLGFLTESAALVVMVLSCFFTFIIGYTLYRGLHTACGCFGSQGEVSLPHLLLDIILALAAWTILTSGAHPPALDYVLNQSSHRTSPARKPSLPLPDSTNDTQT